MVAQEEEKEEQKAQGHIIKPAKLKDRKSVEAQNKGKAAGLKRHITHIDREWFDKNINDKIEIKKKNYNIFTAKLTTQKSLEASLKDFAINKGLNDKLQKMDLLCSNNLDEKFLQTDMV